MCLHRLQTQNTNTEYKEGKVMKGYWIWIPFIGLRKKFPIGSGSLTITISHVGRNMWRLHVSNSSVTEKDQYFDSQREAMDYSEVRWGGSDE